MNLFIGYMYPSRKLKFTREQFKKILGNAENSDRFFHEFGNQLHYAKPKE
ncbi:MAG: hypothetical protein LBF88_02115 [Planctomycetaceae bacterium]|nr:hypothetical protein [Planctomycetaceae bacterium]